MWLKIIDQTDEEKQQYTIAFGKLVDQTDDDLFKEGKVLQLLSLLDTFTSHFREEMRAPYTTNHLQNKLSKHCGNTIIFESKRG